MEGIATLDQWIISTIGEERLEGMTGSSEELEREAKALVGQYYPHTPRFSRLLDAAAGSDAEPAQRVQVLVEAFQAARQAIAVKEQQGVLL